MPHQTPYSTQKSSRQPEPAQTADSVDHPASPVPEPVASVAPPTTSSEVDVLIATELVKPEPRFKAIRALESLRDSLKQTEAQARKDRETEEYKQRQAAIAAAEEQEREQRRAAQKARLDKKNGITDAEVRSLKAQLATVQSELADAQTELVTAKAELVTALSGSAACPACIAKLQELTTELEAKRAELEAKKAELGARRSQ